MKKRAILIVLDSVGIGALPDAHEYGDEKSHTLGNIYAARKKLDLPNLYSLGLSAIEDSRLPMHEKNATGAYGRAMEQTKAKDTTSGHWEMACLPLDVPFRTYPDGFPKDLMDRFETAIGRKTIGNKAVSGTAVLEELGDEHMRTGKPIVYTSADSVFQVAAHEEVIPLDELYHICEIAREMLVGDHLVGRVIARPFLGEDGVFKRTENRKDYALAPPSDTILDLLEKKGLSTVSIGKIEDIFCHRGVGLVDHTRNNLDGINATIKHVDDGTGDFIFTNLVDFDMLYGHRNNVSGYAEALEAFDMMLPQIIDAMKQGDMLMITADHGCDPTTDSTDHSREYIPIVVAGDMVKPNTNISTRTSFADIGATAYEYLTGELPEHGLSFLNEIRR